MTFTGAYLVRGAEQTLARLIVMLEKENVIEKASPDLYARTYRSFGVDDAQDIRARARSRPVAAERRVFALYAPSMTTEAQNALLKTLEEPAANALFFIVVPAPDMLLATVRSRAQTLEIESDASEGPVDADAFLAATAEKRILMLKPLYEHDPPAGGEGRDIGAVISFLSALERRVAAANSHAGIDAIYRARRFATDKGSLLKALLEQVALLVPKM